MEGKQGIRVERHGGTEHGPEHGPEHGTEHGLNASVIFTFDTTSDSLAFEKLCRAEGLPDRLITVPRKITAGCGYAWQAPAGERERICETARAAGRRWAEIHEM